MKFLSLPVGAWRGFKGRLLLTVGGLTMAWGVTVGAYFIHVTTDELASFGGETLHATGVATAELLSTEVRERSQEIDLLRRSPLFVEGDLQGRKVREALDLRKSAHDEYLWLGVAGLDGKVLQATDGVLLGSDVNKRPWFQAAQSGPYAGDVHEAVLLAKHLPQLKPDEPLRFIDFASPIVGPDGRLRAVLAAHASWDWVTDAVVNKVQGPLEHRHAEVLIATSQGEILYPFKYVGSNRLPVSAGSHNARFEVMDWPGEGEFLTSIVPVNEVTAYKLDWHVVLREPVGDAFKEVRAMRERLIAVAMVFLLICMALVYRIARSTSRPIEALAEAARHVVRRDAKPVFPSAEQAGSNEVAELCVSFQSMTESLLARETELKALNASLEEQVASRTAALKDANMRLEGLATTDALTGQRNRRYFDERLQEQFKLFKRSQRAFAVLLLDADHFKRVNDQKGHQAGDEVLKLFARLMNQNTRNTDIVARYGGEEFVILLMDTESCDEGRVVAEKIRLAIESAQFPFVDKMTVSIGLSCTLPTDFDAFQVVHRADRAVYKAKSNGRNRVEMDMD